MEAFYLDPLSSSGPLGLKQLTGSFIHLGQFNDLAEKWHFFCLIALPIQFKENRLQQEH